jgi:hypothetical protein
MRYRALTAIVPLAVAGFSVPDNAAAQQPVEYVRVCDAYGSGYFYIPGTETCLRIGGFAGGSYSWLQNTHEVGGGTIRYGNPGSQNEVFNGSYNDFITRTGVKVGGYVGFAEKKDLGIFNVTGGYLAYEGAWGTESYNQGSEVGVGGVTLVGYTYYQPYNVNQTGISSTINGDRIDSWGELDNSWNRVNFGLKGDWCDFDEEDFGHGGLKIRSRIGLFYEDLNTNGEGESIFTRTIGTPINGIYQNYQFETQDQYFGFRVGTDIIAPSLLNGKLRASLSPDLYLGYHTGEGRFQQSTGTGGGTAYFSDQYSTENFTIGAGITAKLDYSLDNNWRIGAKVEWSYLPQVTSLKTPDDPSEIPTSGFSSQNAQRVIGTFRVSRRF